MSRSIDMNTYYKRLLEIWEMAIEKNVVTHDLFTCFCRTYYYLGGKSESALFLYETSISNAVLRLSDTLHRSPEEVFMEEALKTNEPVYMEFGEKFLELLKIKTSGIKPTRIATSDYTKTRERLARKYSMLKAPQTELRLSNKNKQELKNLPKWKSSAIDDLADVILQLEQFNYREEV